MLQSIRHALAAIKLVVTLVEESCMLELESTHIPKTAGVTFARILQHWYGAEFVCLGNARAMRSPTLDDRVVHAHVPAGTFRAERRICWVRDPARRIVSHYAYLRYEQAGLEHNAASDLQREVRERDMGLEEFAQHPQLVRGMSRWLSDLEVGDFDFIGVQEHFAREIDRCAAVLDKPSVAFEGGENQTTSPEYAALKHSIDEATWTWLRELYPECAELYAEACSLADAWWVTHDGEPLTQRQSTQRVA